MADLTPRADLQALAQVIATDAVLEVVVNNAGVGSSTAVAHLDRAVFEAVIRLHSGMVCRSKPRCLPIIRSSALLSLISADHRALMARNCAELGRGRRFLRWARAVCLGRVQSPPAARHAGRRPRRRALPRCQASDGRICHRRGRIYATAHGAAASQRPSSTAGSGRLR